MSFCRAVPRLTRQYRGRDEEAPDPLEPKVPETVHGASRLGAVGCPAGNDSKVLSKGQVTFKPPLRGSEENQ
jgi:hypothetical protein